MFCRNCGNELQAGDSFCNKCGAKVTLDEERNVINEEKKAPTVFETTDKKKADADSEFPEKIEMDWKKQVEGKRTIKEKPDMSWEIEETPKARVVLPEMHWSTEKPKEKPVEEKVNMVWNQEENRRTTDTSFVWDTDEIPKEQKKSDETFHFDWSAVIDDKERRASKKVPTWRNATSTNLEKKPKEVEESDKENAPEEREMFEWAKPTARAEELELIPPKEESAVKEILPEEPILEAVVPEPIVEDVLPETLVVEEVVPEPAAEEPVVDEVVPEPTVEEALPETQEVVADEIPAAEALPETIIKEPEEVAEETLAAEEASPAVIVKEPEEVAAQEIPGAEEALPETISKEPEEATEEFEEFLEMEALEEESKDILDEPEYISPFDDDDDLDDELKELELELFAEMEENYVNKDATIKVDKFYTLDKKSEEFQELLDREYEKINKSGINYELMETDDESKGDEAPDFELATGGTAEVYDLGEEVFKDQHKTAEKEIPKVVIPAVEKVVVEEKHEEIVEDDDEDEPVKKKSHKALKIFVVVLLILVVFELFVLVMNNFAPENIVTEQLNNVIRQITDLLTSSSVMEDSTTQSSLINVA
ncbi:MAG: zinc-ribbon domain-containing protein [Clostridiales bacterium]|nr:zinc-ribbon domain-containing protein [Clostridiales bacterium]